MIITGKNVLELISILKLKLGEDVSMRDLSRYLNENYNLGIAKIEEKTIDLINDFNIDKVVRIYKDGTFEDFKIKKDKNNDTYSLYSLKDNSEWGISDLSPVLVLELLKKDLEEGLCDKYELLD